MTTKRLIQSFQDVRQIVDEHYRQLLEDDYTAPLFQHLNLETHLPRIYNFWSFILNIEAAEHPYTGSAFEPHARLPLEHQHFQKWMEFLYHAIDQHHDGEMADLWKEKARQMGMLFEYKLGLMDK